MSSQHGDKPERGTNAEGDANGSPKVTSSSGTLGAGQPPSTGPGMVVQQDSHSMHGMGEK